MKHGCDDDRRSAGIRRWLRRVAAGLLAGLVIGGASLVRAQDDPPLPIDPTPLADLLTAPEKMLYAVGAVA